MKEDPTIKAIATYKAEVGCVIVWRAASPRLYVPGSLRGITTHRRGVP